jgi:HAD superfamily hydrolase (TIGR01509 family)
MSKAAPLRSFQAVIFDIDGTLIDSMPIWDNLGARYLRSLQITPEPDLGKILFPMTIAEGVHYLKEHFHLVQAESDIRKGLQNITEQFYRKEVPLKKGAFAFVRLLADHDIPMVLATIGETDLEKAALKRLQILQYFQKMFVCEDYHTTKKESKIYQVCADYLHLAPSKILVVEDLLQAIRSAAQAGFQTAAIYDAASAKDEGQLRQEASLYAMDFDELRGLIEKDNLI